MSRRPVRLPGTGHPLLDIRSSGRAGPGSSRPFSPAEIQQIARTVRRTPEVMVKVTGGGAKVGSVSAHLGYISRDGELEIETDDGERVRDEDEQKQLLKDWHLELTAGHFRKPLADHAAHRKVKLVHNVVLSMPSPTPPDKVLAAARKFAREKFGGQHRYALVLHTDQKHPHVHMVVKAESEHGRRLHIDKEMLREWREDFAQLMREQDVAANATQRIFRGQNKRKTSDSMLRAQRRGDSTAIQERVSSVAAELSRTGTVHDPARAELNETRKAVVARWAGIVDALGMQGDTTLADEVRQFVRRLPPILTDRERLAIELVRYLERAKSVERPAVARARSSEDDLMR
jgi:hypothetical protein